MGCSNCIHESVCLKNYFGFYDADDCKDYLIKDNVKIVDSQHDKAVKDLIKALDDIDRIIRESKEK